MCSHDARSRDLPVLGDVADEDDADVVVLGVADQRLRGAPDLADGAGRGVDRLGPHGLDRVDHDEIEALGRERADDILDVGGGREPDRRVRQAEPFGPHPHLRGRFFARNVGDAATLAGQRRAGLDQQRRLADAGFAAEQDHGARHEAAARHPIELADAGLGAERLGAGGGETLEGDLPALRQRLAGGRCADPAGRRLLDDGVPGPAGVALPLPAARHRAAGLADEGGAGFGHSLRMLERRHRPTGGAASRRSEMRETRTLQTPLIRAGPHIDPPMAAPEVDEDLVADGAAGAGEIVDRHGVAE